MAQSHWGSKILWRSVNVVRQVAERERRSIVLEELLPGLIVIFILFPVSQGGRKWNIRWAFAEYVLSRVGGVKSAMFAVCREFWVEALSIFTRRGVSGDGVSHSTNGRYVIAQKVDEERLRLFVTDTGLEHPLATSDWEPTVTFVRLGR